MVLPLVIVLFLVILLPLVKSGGAVAFLSMGQGQPTTASPLAGREYNQPFRTTVIRSENLSPCLKFGIFASTPPLLSGSSVPTASPQPQRRPGTPSTSSPWQPWLPHPGPTNELWFSGVSIPLLAQSAFIPISVQARLRSSQPARRSACTGTTRRPACSSASRPLRPCITRMTWQSRRGPAPELRAGPVTLQSRAQGRPLTRFRRPRQFRWTMTHAGWSTLRW